MGSKKEIEEVDREKQKIREDERNLRMEEFKLRQKPLREKMIKTSTEKKNRITDKIRKAKTS